MSTDFIAISLDNLDRVLGGKTDEPPKPDPLVSKETLGCAVGGFLGAPAGPAGVAAGCVAGAALANSIDRQRDPDAALEGLKGMGTT